MQRSGQKNFITRKRSFFNLYGNIIAVMRLHLSNICPSDGTLNGAPGPWHAKDRFSGCRRRVGS